MSSLPDPPQLVPKNLPKNINPSPLISPSGSGTGPEQALEAITLSPSRRARKVHTSPELPCARRTDPAEPHPPTQNSLSPTPNRSKVQPVPNLQSSHWSLSPKSQQHHPRHHRAAAGPGRSKHWKRSTSPLRAQREKSIPPPSFPARAGPIPRSTTTTTTQTQTQNNNTCHTSYLASQSTYDNELAKPRLHYGIPRFAHRAADGPVDQAKIHAVVGPHPHHTHHRMGTGIRSGHHRKSTHREFRGSRVIRAHVRLALRSGMVSSPSHPLRRHPLGPPIHPSQIARLRTAEPEPAVILVVRLVPESPLIPDSS